jgi:hypothetical protein
MRILVVLAAACLAASCAADSPPLMGTRHLIASADQKVCRRSPTLGSNTIKRECHTVAEWEALARSGAAAVQDLERRVNNGAAANPDEATSE